MRDDYGQPQLTRLFAAVALTFGVLFVFLTPPFQVPDEPAHLFRAFAISRGVAYSIDRSGQVGTVLPQTLTELASSNLGTDPEKRKATVSLSETVAALSVPLESTRTVFLHVPPLRKPSPVSFSALGYPPFLYLPQSGIIAALRLVETPAVWLLYAARLVNVLTGTFILLLGVRLAPFGRRTAAAIAMLPMSVVLRSSASTDAILLPLVFLFASAVFHSTTINAGLTRRMSAGLALTAFLFSSGRPPYAVLASLVLLAGAPRRHLLAKAVVLTSAFAGVVTAFAWMRWVPHPIALIGTTINGAARLRGALSDPLRFLAEMWGHAVELGPFYVREMVGNLGWLDRPLPLWSTTVVGCGAVLIAAIDGPGTEDLGVFRRMFLVAVATLSVFAIAFAMHLGTPFEAGFLTGLQGRYFIPVLWPALTAIGLGSVGHTSRRIGNITLTMTVAIGLAVSAVTTIAWYTR